MSDLGSKTLPFRIISTTLPSPLRLHLLLAVTPGAVHGTSHLIGSQVRELGLDRLETLAFGFQVSDSIKDLIQFVWLLSSQHLTCLRNK